jgi:hypothetical protein
LGQEAQQQRALNSWALWWRINCWKMEAAVESARASEDPAEREIFETIKATYAFALEPEQQAMVKQLKTNLSTIPVGQRVALIDAVESAIGQNIEGEEFDL